MRDGFKGPIFATAPTRALMRIVLEDAVHLQRHLRKRGFHEEPYAPPPFYDESNVQQTIQQTKPFELETTFDVVGFPAIYKNAAHIIGSAFVAIEVEGRRVVFSGDVGRYNRTLLYDPTPIGEADVLVCESTYGDRVHPPDALDQLGQTLVAGVARGGAIVIPAFAVERSQEILFSIGQLQRKYPALAHVPVFLDSPMAAHVDELFKDYPAWHKPIEFETGGKPFGCDNLTIAVETEQSKAINNVRGPHIIVSASGMAAGGRVLHHLHNHVSGPECDHSLRRFPRRRNARLSADERREIRKDLRRRSAGEGGDRHHLRLQRARRPQRNTAMAQYVHQQADVLRRARRSGLRAIALRSH